VGEAVDVCSAVSAAALPVLSALAGLILGVYRVGWTPNVASGAGLLVGTMLTVVPTSRSSSSSWRAPRIGHPATSTSVSDGGCSTVGHHSIDLAVAIGCTVTATDPLGRCRQPAGDAFTPPNEHHTAFRGTRVV
jgi:hypothetical protein